MLRATFFLVFVCTAASFGHSGGTDASGCHTNRKTGDYHCHGGGTRSSSSSSSSSSTSSSSSQVGFTCGTKTKCAQMSSCEEAYFYLQTCGLGRLDRDGDGVPCEVICR